MTDRSRVYHIWCLGVAFAFLLVGPRSLRAGFAGGRGEPNDPYRIATAEQLLSIGADPNLLDKHYVLVSDLDLDPNLPGRRIFDRAVIAPDMRNEGGNDRIDFAGTFDGAHHKIRNLTIRAEAATWLGLFGRVSETSRIFDLALEDVSIAGGERAGGLAGWNMGEIVNCRSGGVITGKMMLGGLVGQTGGRVLHSHSAANVVGGERRFSLGGLVGMSMMDAVIHDCHATGHVSAGPKSWSLGGLVGDFYTLDGAISECYATGDVSSEAGSNCLGGLIGQAMMGGTIRCCYASGGVLAGDGSKNLGGLIGASSAQNLTDCYATGNVLGGHGTWPTGGLVGSASPMRGVITNCYAVGKLTGGGTRKGPGGLIGETPNPDFIAVSNCFWDVDTSGVQTSAAGQGLTTAQMHDIETYKKAGWDLAGDNTDGMADIWQMPEGGGYPQLAVFSKTHVPHRLAGSGTPHDPYRIAQVEDLSAIEGTKPAYYKLTLDIDLSGIIWSNAPIPEFTGGFDGDGHRITNLTIRSSMPGKLGFFGSVEDGAWVRNLGLERVAIVGPDGLREIGGLAGSSYGHIANCYVTGRISAGRNSLFLGGLVGDTRMGSIRDCYARVEISAGGGTEKIGGLTGYNYMCTIVNCYAAGKILAEEGCDDISGLVEARAEGVNRCFWDVQVSGLTESDAGRGLPTAEMHDRQTFLDAGWDFVDERRNGLADVWRMPEKGGYPILARFDKGYSPRALSGQGTPEEPYRIASPEDLVAINHHNRLGCYRLANNIDLAGITWTQPPIPSFIGSFDGAGHAISSLTIQGGNHLGLFGILGSQAKIVNLTLKDVHIAADHEARYIGPLGGMSHGTILNCHAIGKVSAGVKSRAVGGLVGDVEAGQVTDCHTRCDILGGPRAYHIGGLIGFSLAGQVRRCFASGNIRAGEEARAIGGLIGEVHFWTEVSDCYAVAQVTTGRESGGVGGLVGIASEGDLFPSQGKIAQCFAAGVVDPGEESSDVGGLLGVETKVQPLTQNCYFLARAASRSVSNAYGSGLTGEQMRQQSSFAGWDFDTVWTIREEQDYPRLRWEEP